ncbi:sensor domain-containing diguanylate cyclase [Aliidiomarina sanyensis]|uniref:GGDEF domain-containing protein n=1 Tax=Aliidiomarina sanyensis TaxID=1249555 RepID=A0A432WKG9_9GAMM|nr:diguanylate cyclase [Aliidiomarina sanyensis]RUO34264.1 GGDEF domain-containing protein [Aliidiomarina sanyensis]
MSFDLLQRAGVSSEILSSVLDNVGAYVYIKDLNGQYLYANQQTLRLFDITLQGLAGKTDGHFFDLERSRALRDNDVRVLKSGETLTTEEENILKSTGESRTFLSVKKPLRDETGDIIGMFGVSTDITERKMLEKQLRQQNELLQIVMDNVDSAIFMLDEYNNLLYANKQLAEQFKLQRVGPQHTPIASFVDENAYKELAEHNQFVFESAEKQAFRENVMGPDGEQRVFWSVKVPYVNEEQEKVIIGLSTDMTELFKLQEKLREQSTQDPMTGLYNRRFFMDFAEKTLAESERSRRTTSILLIDLDHFKQVNDEHGHPIGDMVLYEISRRIVKSLRRGDIAARVGGEEFAVLLPNTPLNAATEVANRICKLARMNPVKFPEDNHVTVTLSIGVAASAKSLQSFEGIYALADKYLYQAKRKGRDQVCAATPDDHPLP